MLLSASATVGNETGDLDLVGSLGATTVASSAYDCADRRDAKCQPVLNPDNVRAVQIPEGAEVVWARLTWVTASATDTVGLAVNGAEPVGTTGSVSTCPQGTCAVGTADVTAALGAGGKVSVVIPARSALGPEGSWPLAAWSVTVVYLTGDGPSAQVGFLPSVQYSRANTVTTVVPATASKLPISSLATIVWAVDPDGAKKLLVGGQDAKTGAIDGSVERGGTVYGSGVQLLELGAPSVPIPNAGYGAVELGNVGTRTEDWLFVGPTAVVRMVPAPGRPSP